MGLTGGDLDQAGKGEESKRGAAGPQRGVDGAWFCRNQRSVMRIFVGGMWDALILMKTAV